MTRRVVDLTTATSSTTADKAVIVQNNQVKIVEIDDLPIPKSVSDEFVLVRGEVSGSSNSRANHTGQDRLTTITKTASYTVEAAYVATPTLIIMNSASSTTVTIPTNANAPANAGAKILVLKAGSGNVVVAGDTGVTVISPDSLTATVLNTMYECLKIGPNLWWVAHHVSGTAAGTPPTPTDPPTFTANPQITYSTTTSGSVMTCTSGTTTGSPTITRRWGYRDDVSAGGPFEGYIIPAQTGSTYTTGDTDINSSVWCDVTATNAYGTVTVRALGPLITASAPAPAPPPAPNTTNRGPRIGSFTPSGAITATSGQTISGLSFTGTGTKIHIPVGVTGVTIEDCDISSSTNCIYIQGTNCTVRYCNIHDSGRGILLDSCSNITIQYNTFSDFLYVGETISSHAIDNQSNIGPTLIDSNDFTGTYESDAVSNFQTSRVTFTNNDFNITIDEPSSAAFTIGDGLEPINRGRDNYIAFNTVTQAGGGVPCGVFGSDGNTIFEYNCLKAGIQAYAYPNENPGPFLGVVIRKNVINMGLSYVPNTAIISEWATNVDSTNCALMPA